MSANEKQVGGRHYKTEYEHWDLAIKVPMTYLEGCATKHVARWRKKNGVQDLQKAMHYLEKLIETVNYEDMSRKLTRPEIHVEINNFALMNNLSLAEEEFIVILCTHQNLFDLRHAHALVEELIIEAEIAVKRNVEVTHPGTPDDGGHHARGE
jgi:hypothetical protein